MPTTYTSNLQITQPAINDASTENAWGQLTNTDWAIVDQAVVGILSLSVAGSSNVTLTSMQGGTDQSKNRSYIFTGALTGNIYVFWPSGLTRNFRVTNSTTGSFTLTLAVNDSGSPAGDTIVVPQGETISVYSDGTNILADNATAGNLTVNGTFTATSNTTVSSGTSLSVSSGATVTISAGATLTVSSGATLSASSGATVTLKQPTGTILTSGSSATYTTPTGAVRLVVRAVGAGGGGGGAGTSGGGAGSGGGNTIFGGSITAGGGGGGEGGGTAGAGGTGSGPTGALVVPGAPGGTGTSYVNTGGSGVGGSGPWGGAGAAGYNSSGGFGAANSGSGGGGAGGNGGGNNNIIAGSGGGAGAYVEAVLESVASSYTYTIGTGGGGGTAGSSGGLGGAGGSGVIVIDEFYY